MPDTQQQQPSAAHSSEETATAGRSVFVRYIGKQEVKPEATAQMSLGSFTAKQPAKGFSIEITPTPRQEGSVVTDMFTPGNDREYEVQLLIANYGPTTVTVEVWAL